jgi:hypothetical protein
MLTAQGTFKINRHKHTEAHTTTQRMCVLTHCLHSRVWDHLLGLPVTVCCLHLSAAPCVHADTHRRHTAHGEQQQQQDRYMSMHPYTSCVLKVLK